MNISTLKIAWKYLTGGIDSVAGYLLGIMNNALGSISAGNKAKIQAVLNVCEKVLATLTALKWLCPTKWQTAYSATMMVICDIVDSLRDLNISDGELTIIRDKFTAAWKAWESDDDETCVDCLED